MSKLTSVLKFPIEPKMKWAMDSLVNLNGGRRMMFLCFLGFVVVCVGACRETKKPPTSGKKQVVTSFTILADMAREVAGDAAEVQSITKPGAEIHGYEPTPKDVVKAQHADLVLWNGLNLELWFEKFFANVKGVPSAVLTAGIEPLGITEGPYAGRPNPHAWMAPGMSVVWPRPLIMNSCGKTNMLLLTPHDLLHLPAWEMTSLKGIAPRSVQILTTC